MINSFSNKVIKVHFYCNTLRNSFQMFSLFKSYQYYFINKILVSLLWMSSLLLWISKNVLNITIFGEGVFIPFSREFCFVFSYFDSDSYFHFPHSAPIANCGTLHCKLFWLILYYVNLFLVPLRFAFFFVWLKNLM